MEIKKYTCIFLLVLAGLMSCAKTEIEDANSHVGNDVIKALIDRHSTKTFFGTDGLTTFWSAGDKLGIYTLEKGGNIQFVAATAEDAYNGFFKGSLNGGTPMYAYYPYTEQSGNFDAVALHLSPEQDAYNISDYDFKACIQSSENQTGEFELNFRSVLSVFYVTFNAVGTSLEDKSLKSIKVQALPIDDSTELPAVSGDFTMNLQNTTTNFTGATYDYAKLVWETPIALSEGVAKGYMFVNPESVNVGTPLKVTFETAEGTTVTADFVSTKDCKANTRYTFNLVLAESEDDVIIEGNPFTSISFLQSANSEKLIKTSKFERSYSNRYYTNTEIANDIICSWNEADKVWEAIIPYLYDFSGLKASFVTIEEGAKVYVNGELIESGQTALDFNQPVTYIVESPSGVRQSATLRVKNTGLPVVTINGTVYSKATDFDDIEGTTTININGTDYTCGLRLRGNTTQEMPKKPYAFKLDKKAEILGMPKHKRWVLLANWLDRTMLRNDMAFYLAQQTGAWAPHGQPVELVLNNVHVGNYYLCEQIKIDENRVNIADYGWDDLVEEVGANPTEQDIADKIGYLLECDQSTDNTEIYFQNTSPVRFYTYIKDPGDVADLGNGKNPTPAYTYIKNYYTTVGTALRSSDWSTVRTMIDYQSFVDHWLFSELTENQESKHPKSFYMHKVQGGKLHAGPAWDYDWGTFIPASYIGNSSYGETSSTAGKIQNKFTMRYTMWYQYLFNDSEFKALVKSRWAELYPKFQTALIHLEERAELVRLSDTFNHPMWPIEGMLVNSWYSYGFPNHDEKLAFDDAIEQMRSSLEARLQWLDTEIGKL